MATPITDPQRMVEELNQYILPSTLMQCFDAYREENYKEAIKLVPEPTLAWFLVLLNRYRGPEDRKDSLLEVFDPSLYTENHPAWERPPGRIIELPALTSEIVDRAQKDSEMTKVAGQEILHFRDHADTYDDEELMQPGAIAKAGLADMEKAFETRDEVVRYLALNASSRIEDLWVAGASEWLEAPARRIEFPDMVARRRGQLAGQLAPSLTEKDFVCYSDHELRTFACDMRSLFLHDRSRHLAVCTKCQLRLEAWTKIVSDFDKHGMNKKGRPDA